MGTLWQDVKFGLRMLAKNPGFTATAIITLALAIGANTALFSLVDAVLFRPLAVSHPAELVRIGSSATPLDPPGQSLSYPLYTEYRDNSAAIFTGVAAYSDRLQVTLAQESGMGAPATAAVVTGNYFELLGVRALRGRAIVPEDDAPGGGNDVVVLSYRYWQQIFAGHSDAIGGKLRVNGYPFLIVGVTPRDFFGVGLNSIPDVWLPMSAATRAEPIYRGQMDMIENPFFGVVARLKPRVTLAQAQEQLSAAAARMDAGKPLAITHSYAGKSESYHWPKPWPVLAPASDQAGKNWTKLSWMLLGVCALVLLVGASDLASLLLARAERRQREIAIRIALGASRMQIMRGLLVEGLLLAAAGAVAGLLVATWSAGVVRAAGSAQTGLPVTAGASILDARVLAFTAGVALLSGLVFSFAPAWRASRTGISSVLKGDARTSAGGRPRATLRSGLIVFQIAASALLLVGAGLFLRALFSAASQDPGFDAGHIFTADLNLAKQGYSPAAARAFLDPLLQSVTAAPGVRYAAIEAAAGAQGNAKNQKDQKNLSMALSLWRVTPEYFATLGVPLLRGREFAPNAREGGPYEGLVNETLIREYWPGEDPIGKTIGPFTPMGAIVEIVGVVPDIRTANLSDPPPPTLYVSLSRFYSAYPWQPTISILVRTDGDPRGALPSLFAAVTRLDKNLALLRPRTETERLASGFDRQRFLAALLASFAALAVLLAATGLYGLISYATTGRTREIGVRMALGAEPGHVLRLVLRSGIGLALAGLCVGLTAAAALTRVVAGMLYGVRPDDPTTFVGVAFLLMAVALLACYVPARRAANTDPMTALRSE
jgi:putative ABC transport system permease protein